MALHVVKDANADDDAMDMFASALSERTPAKHRMPDDHSPPEVVYSLIHNELLLDRNAAQILATFCKSLPMKELLPTEIRRPRRLQVPDEPVSPPHLLTSLPHHPEGLR